MRSSLIKNKKAVANPIEFTIVIGVLITAFALLFSSIGQMFIPYSVENTDLQAKAIEISERLVKDVGQCKNGDVAWEYNKNPNSNLTYLGLANYYVLYDSWIDGFPTGGETSQALVADAGGPYFFDENEENQLQGSASGGTSPYSFQWNITNGVESADYVWVNSNGDNATPTIKFMQNGTYTAELTVTDNEGSTSSDYASIIVTEIVNIPPTASFTWSPVSPDVDETINFDATGSSDSDGSIVQYDWKWFSGDVWHNDLGSTPSHSYSSSGTYVVSLRVTDDDGDVDVLTKPVPVGYSGNVLPNADFSWSPYNPTDLDTIQFSDDSTDSDGFIVSWSWDFGDGNNSSLQDPAHEYTLPGIYTVSLTVIDDNDSTDIETKIDYITVFGNDPPAATANVQITISEDNAVINWDAVNTTIYSDPIQPDGYIVLNYQDPYSEFTFLSFTPTTTYTHSYVGQYIDKMFYKIITVVDMSREGIEYLKSLNNSHNKVKWTEVKRNIYEKRK